MARLQLLLFSCIIIAVASVASGKLWPQGTICYRYDSCVTLRLQKVIRQAMDIWGNATCLNFVHSIEADCVVFYSHPNEEYCTTTSTGLGSGGEQKVTLGYSCQTEGDLLYTLGLIMGLQTEQNRPDRSRYVRILTDNIEDGEERNFAVYSYLTTGYQGVGYDYASVMHLSTSAYSTRGQVTTEVVNTNEYSAQGHPKLGNRLGLNQGDILKANRLYTCPGVGMCEVLSVNIETIRDLVTDRTGSYQVELVGIDGEGSMQNLSSTSVQSDYIGNLNFSETLRFQVNTAKWQFFRLLVKKLPHTLLTMVETVPLEVRRSPIFHRSVVTELSTAEISFSYECTADGNDCDPNPCVSATGCNDELFDYTCDCQEGFGGKNCNIRCPNGFSGYNCNVDISGDSCLANPCIEGNSVDCTDAFFDYTCTCRTGYGGKNCEISCPRGYSGRNCEHDISGDSCRPNPCHTRNSIGCVDKIYDYTCTCYTGFGGKNCERSCPHGYGGFNCNIDVSGDSCSPNPCSTANSVSCVDGFFDYTCNCRTGYGGKECNRACPRGYDGYHCNIDISGDSCASNPCHSRNTRRCIDGFFDYTCECNPGFGGETCSRDLCASGICNNNGGSCVPYRYSPKYQCVCPLAWTPVSHCSTWEPRCLQVVIKRARGLSDRDGFLKGDSDPYTKIRAYTSTGYSESGRTRYIQGDESPTWNHRFNAGCGHTWNRFYFRIYDDDWGSDDALSSGQYVYLADLDSLPKCDLTVDVQGGRGTITFDVYYYTQYGPGQPGSC